MEQGGQQNDNGKEDIADQYGERWAFVLLSVLVMVGGLIAASTQKSVEADVANAQQA